MKKLMLLVAACLVMVACNNKPAEVEEPTTDTTAVVEEEHPCCQMMKDWADFENKTVEEQAALIEKRGDHITHRFAEKNIEEIECPEMKAELGAFAEKWNKEFAAADPAGKKALIDEMDALMQKYCPKDGCCKKECCKKECCCDKKDCCKEGCCKDNCTCKDECCGKEGCCKKEGETCCKK